LASAVIAGIINAIMDDIRKARLAAFTEWAAQNIRGDEKGEAQIFLDRLFQAFGQPGCLDVGGQPEFRIRKDKDDGGGIAFADYVWKPIVLIEMKRRGADLARHYRQAFDYWARRVFGRWRRRGGRFGGFGRRRWPRWPAGCGRCIARSNCPELTR
jgi:hypothetical protein